MESGVISQHTFLPLRRLIFLSRVFLQGGWKRNPLQLVDSPLQSHEPSRHSDRRRGKMASMLYEGRGESCPTHVIAFKCIVHLVIQHFIFLNPCTPGVTFFYIQIILLILLISIILL